MSTTSTTSPRRAAPLLFLVIFAVVCGFVGVAFRIFNQTELVEKPAPPPQMQIPVAVADLQPGRKIQPSDYFMKPMPNEELLKFAEGKYVFNSGKDLNGRILKQVVKAGAPFVLDCVYLEGTGPTPAELLTDGMRALTVSVTLVGGVRGFVAPNSWVDVLFRRGQGDVPESTEIARTHTLLSGVRVIALQDSTYASTVLFSDKNRRSTDAFELTLEVTPEQAEVLKSLEGRGDLSLNMLPNDPDRKNLGNLPSPEVMKIVLGVEEPKPVLPPAPPVYPPSVRIVRGGAQSQVTVDFQTDLIMDDSLYPAPTQYTTPQPDPPTPPVPAQPARPLWPQRRIQPVPAPAADADEASDKSNPSPDAPAAAGQPTSVQPPRRSQNDGTSIIVQQRLNSPSRQRPLTPVNTSRLQPSSIQTPVRSSRAVQTPVRSSQANRYPTTSYPGISATRPLQTTRQLIPSQPRSYVSGYSPVRRTTTASSQFSAVRRTVGYSSQRKSLLTLSPGPQTTRPATLRPLAPSAPARYASDPLRPVVLSTSVPNSVRRSVPSKYPERRTAGSTVLVPYIVSSTVPPQTTRLPIMKSGPQD